MKKQTIENMCANHIRVKHRLSAYIKEEDFLCENCTGYDTNCSHYIPYKNGCSIPVRQGIVAYRIENGTRKY